MGLSVLNTTVLNAGPLNAYVHETFAISVAEALSGADSPSSVFVTHSEATEAIFSADQQVGLISFSKAVAESGSLAALVSAAVRVFTERAEALVAADTATELVFLHVTSTETLSGSDSQNSVFVTSLSINESGSAASTQLGLSAYPNAVAEALSALSAAGGLLLAVGGRAEALSAAMTTTGLLRAVGARVEALSAADTESVHVWVPTYVTETLTAAATQAAQWGFVGVTREALTAAMAANGTFVSFPSTRYESVVSTDTQRVSATVPGVINESVTLVINGVAFVAHAITLEAATTGYAMYVLSFDPPTATAVAVPNSIYVGDIYVNGVLAD